MKPIPDLLFLILIVILKILKYHKNNKLILLGYDLSGYTLRIL
jgi:hypothetical protein